MSAPNAREKLFASAAVLFQRFGYARVSIRDITSSVGIPKGTFYNHFRSKEALASAMLSQHFNALLDVLGEGGSETAGARLRRHFESTAPSTQEPSPGGRVLKFEPADNCSLQSMVVDVRTLGIRSVA